jgi:hypothetical protein
LKLHARGLTVLVGAAALTTAALSVAPAYAATAKSNGVRDPYSPAYSHSYRHGVIPTRAVNAKMKSWSNKHAATTAATGTETLSYGGGVDGIGVQSGHSKVYLVFYGTQWGTSSTDANGNLKFTGDQYGGAGGAPQMLKGLGPNVASGATSCPSNAAFIPYQSGGVLSGVWYDNSKASPSAASAAQLGQEAVGAASHFGNTTAAANRDSYYVILSPHGTNPDNYQGQYCAWHDYNGDVGVSSPYGDIAFSNFVNSGSAGMTDGYTMTLGHEWHEMMSDQNPAGGWTNHTGSSYNGEENSDECAWLSPGTSGGAANIAFATGTFAEQASWSNDTNNCAISHPIVGGGTGGGNTVTVTNPGSQTGTVGTAKSVQIQATDSGGATLTYTATGLPAGESINASTGLISGTPTAAGTYSTTVTAKDSTNASGSATFSWTISSSGGGGCSGQKLLNPGFESGATSWSQTSGVINTDGAHSHAGSGYAWLDGYGTTHTDTLSQSVAIPAGCKAALTYYLSITTSETTTTTAYDKLTLTANGTSKQTFSNLNKGAYAQRTVDLSSYAGQTVTIKWTGTEDSSLATSFLIDDTALTLS